MTDTRTRVRRAIEVISLAGAALTCALSGNFAQMVADATPVALGQMPLKSLPILTSHALVWKAHLPAIGISLAAAITVAAVLIFLVSKNEDTRLQSTLVISTIGYVAALKVWAFVGISLVVLPHYAHGI